MIFDFRGGGGGGVRVERVGCYPYQYGICSKITNKFLFLFSNKMWVIRAGIYKYLVRTASREDLGLLWLLKHFFQATCIRIFRTSTILATFVISLDPNDTGPFFRVHTAKYDYNSRTFQGLLKASPTVFKDLKIMNLLIKVLKFFFRNARLRYLRH